MAKKHEKQTKENLT